VSQKKQIVPFVDLKRIHEPIVKDLMRVTQEIIKSSQFVMGESLKKFEERFSSYVGSRYGVGVASGADALFLALKAIGIKQGDEVITVNNTFNATVDAILRAGAIPRIVDVKKNDLLMNVDLIEKAITEKTKAIIPVHLYGNPVQMDFLMKMRDKNDGNIKIIQDAAQAHGATYHNKPLGFFGDILCYSFYPPKNLGALGEGGFVASDDPEICTEIKILRNCGQIKKYFHTKVGFNSRLENLQAAYLLIKLEKLEEWNQSRRKSAFRYYECIEKLENIQMLQEDEKGKSVFHLFVIRLKQREKLIEIFQRKRIQFGIHYPIPINKAEAYKEYKFSKESFDVSERAAEEILSLPMFPYMRNDEIERVVEALELYNHNFV